MKTAAVISAIVIRAQARVLVETRAQCPFENNGIADNTILYYVCGYRRIYCH